MLAAALAFLVLNPPTNLLGEGDGGTLYVEVNYRDAAEDGTVGDYSLTFLRKEQGKVVSKSTFSCGSSFGVPEQLSIQDFFHREGDRYERRKQVFISLFSQGARSYLLEYDGKRIEVLYSNEVGRVIAHALPLGDGRCQITEFWPKQQFEGSQRPNKDNFAIIRLTLKPGQAPRIEK
jgi:hypothetical protein